MNKNHRPKGLFIFDIIITIIIFLWVIKTFTEGDTVKGLIFTLLFVVMASFLFLSYRKKK
ncbi:hypothetical protein [Bacillus seohaeanensis]|jgi:hypothetical protein|uniref:Uncharacterized protein n=1 Tax=Bacillus seohaeanensis TaxID=284580 RepID=A0ABW5RXT0_9BACI